MVVALYAEAAPIMAEPINREDLMFTVVPDYDVEEIK